MSDDPFIKILVEKTGDPAENKERARQALEYGVNAAASDPGVLIRMALGRAYSDLHTNGIPRSQVVEHLRDLFADDMLHEAALAYQQRLLLLVAGRTKGDRCGDYVGKVQLELLTEVLMPTPERPDAA